MASGPRFRPLEGTSHEDQGSPRVKGIDPLAPGSLLGAVGAPAIVGDSAVAFEDASADGAAVLIDAPREGPPVQVPARGPAGAPEIRAVAAGQALQRQAHMDGLVDQDPEQVVGIDLEIGRRDLDDGPPEAATLPFDDGAPGAPQPPVPAQRDLGPQGDVERAAHGVEGSLVGQVQIAGRQHVARSLRSRADAQRGSRLRRHGYHGGMPRSILLPLVVSALVLAGCGGPGGVDRSHYQPVFDAAMQAVSARDLPALEALLSPAGQQGLEATLLDFQHRLQDPEQGALILELAAERRGAIDPGELDAARHGTLAAAWHFLLRSDPRPSVPGRQAARRLPDGAGVVVEYADPRGTLRMVTLSERDGHWAVDDLQL